MLVLSNINIKTAIMDTPDRISGNANNALLLFKLNIKYNRPETIKILPVPIK